MECLFIVARCGVFIYSSAVWSVIVPVHCKREETPICVFAEILLSIWLAELLRGPFPPSFLADVDECRTEANDCDFNARCYNTEGSFECRCNPGYRGDGRTCQREYAHLVAGGGGGGGGIHLGSYKQQTMQFNLRLPTRKRPVRWPFAVIPKL